MWARWGKVWGKPVVDNGDDIPSAQPLSAAKQAEQIRLAKALRENLKRRKLQVRQREAVQPGPAQHGAMPK